MNNFKVFLFLLIVGFSSVKGFGYENSTTDFFSCFSLNNDGYYRGVLGIPVSGDLVDGQELIDEAVFAAELAQDLDRAEALYRLIPDSLNGKVLDTDIARNLYGPYAEDVEERHRYVCSTLMPAALFVDYLYFKFISKSVSSYEGDSSFKGSIVFLAGGDGSGKTTSVRVLGLSVFEEAVLIKDSTMTSDFEYYCDMIERTLEGGFGVTIIYVFRPVELALEGNVKRALEVGRVRPLVEIAEAHYKAQQNVLKLKKYFGDRIKVLVIDNSQGLEEVRLVSNPIRFLKSFRVYYKSEDEVFKRAFWAYDELDKVKIPVRITELLERRL